MNKILLVILLCFISVPAFALDTLYSHAGDYIYLKIELDKTLKLDSLKNISATLEIEERTLIDPISFCDKDTNDIVSFLDTKDNYSYTMETNIEESVKLSDYIFIKCRVLAGADSVTTIDLKHIKLPDQNLPEQNYILNILYSNQTLKYIRFVNFSKLYPSPLYSGQDLICEFSLDRVSTVEFILVSNEGETYLLDKKIFPKGDVKHHLQTNKNLSAGSYRLRLVTNHGEISKKIMVVK